ncbi:MAG TPA: site-2 protease family protein [Solirubrobacteraceae bacterium]|nr:site-2 protease family protein [Solirubrobacteraceae bacterium]
MRPIRPRRTIALARIAGIRVGVSVSFLLTLFLFIFVFTPYFHSVLGGSYTSAYLLAVASGLAFLASLVIHELGHALVARRNGLQVLGIEVRALGGVTRTLGEGPQTPGAQFRLAASGPALSAALLAAATFLGTAMMGAGRFLSLASASSGAHAGAGALFLAWLALLNALVLALNLLPAFPLDGAQILQAALWRLRGERNSAARATGRIGQLIALLLGAGGLYLLAHSYLEGAFVAVLSLFLYQSASAAVLQGAIGERLERLTVADIIDRDPEVLPDDLRILEAQEQYFTPRRPPWLAVVDQARRFLGVVRAERIEREIAAGRPALTVGELIEGDRDLPVELADDAPVSSLLRSEVLGRWGGLVAVDRDGVLRGVVTVGQIRRALRTIAGR